MIRTFLFALITVAAASTTVHAENEISIIDPEKVTADYEIQGEYTGDLGGNRYGMQVIALGNDDYSAVVYPGGLPGDGYEGYGKIEAKGRTEDGVTKITADGTGYSIIKDGMATVFSAAQGEVGELKRVVRESATLGKEPPEEAIVLFDGSSAEEFKGGKLILNDLLLADCETTQQFGDHTLHLEFRLPYEPLDRGQARGNSGVYIQGRYELQVLDSFGLNGENNECGGIYQIAKPKVNACFPPLTWQTYDIDFTAARWENGKKTKNARVTIRHNDIMIHKDLELTRGTPGKNKEAEGPGILYLQGHGNQVVYRNIWVVEK